jgi:glycosyltransferase involved in cell wall biosynthesis
MHATLIVPAPDCCTYERRIVEGLLADGHAVDVHELIGAAGGGAVLAALPAVTIPVIDGMALPAFADCAEALAARPCVGLIHRPIDHAIERRLFAGLARVIATSAATAEYLVSTFDVMPERIAVVVPGTDDAPRATGSGGPGCNVLSVGGHDLLLRALARLFDLDWRLTVVGTPARGLQALADELGIAARVTFAGAADDATRDALWQSTDVFAGGCGLAVAEALKRGVPVVVTNGGAAGALVTLESGMVCPPGDQDQLSKSLRRIIFGIALRHDMAEAAWRVGQALPDWPTQVKAFAGVLAGAAACPHPGPLPRAGEGEASQSF